MKSTHKTLHSFTTLTSHLSSTAHDFGGGICPAGCLPVILVLYSSSCSHPPPSSPVSILSQFKRALHLFNCIHHPPFLPLQLLHFALGTPLSITVGFYLLHSLPVCATFYFPTTAACASSLAFILPLTGSPMNHHAPRAIGSSQTERHSIAFCAHSNQRSRLSYAVQPPLRAEKNRGIPGVGFTENTPGQPAPGLQAGFWFPALWQLLLAALGGISSSFSHLPAVHSNTCHHLFSLDWACCPATMTSFLARISPRRRNNMGAHLNIAI